MQVDKYGDIFAITVQEGEKMIDYDTNVIIIAQRTITMVDLLVPNSMFGLRKMVGPMGQEATHDGTWDFYKTAFNMVLSSQDKTFWHPYQKLKFAKIRCFDPILELMPTGGGFDKWTVDVTDDNKIILESEYHAMHESGIYAGWYPIQVEVLDEELDLPLKEMADRLQFGADDAVEQLYVDYSDELYCQEAEKEWS